MPMDRVSSVALPYDGSQAPRRSAARPLWRQLAGGALRERRRAAGLRLRDVAERAGLSPQYLSEVERGRKEPSSEMLESICGGLEWDLVDLVHAVGHQLTGTDAFPGRLVRSAPDGVGRQRVERVVGANGEGSAQDLAGDGAQAGITVTAKEPLLRIAGRSPSAVGRSTPGAALMAA